MSADAADALQAIEHLADQIDRLVAMLEEVVILRRAGAPISESRVDRYAAELERLQSERPQLRETIAKFWALIGKTDALWLAAHLSSSSRIACVGAPQPLFVGHDSRVLRLRRPRRRCVCGDRYRGVIRIELAVRPQISARIAAVVFQEPPCNVQ